MNILIFSRNSHYNESPTGGAETSLRLIAEKFSSIGENVVYVAQSKSKIPSIKIKIIDNVKVYFISPIRWPSLNKNVSSPLKDKFIKNQIRFIVKKIIQKENVQIIHTYNEYLDTFDILKIREESNLKYKVIIRLAGLCWYESCLKNPERTKKIEWVFNNVDKIGFISNGLEELFNKHTKSLGMNITKTNKAVLDIGYNKNVFTSKWRNHNSYPFKMVMIARFSHRAKRQDLLIKALNLLRDKNLELHFVGAGAKKKDLFNLAKTNNLSEKIVFHGFLEQKKLMEILLTSHLFCMATDYEGLCKSVIEAMSIGIPVLASDVTPLNNYIKNELNGFLSKNDPKSWAQNILKIYERKYDLDKISKNEINFVQQNYDPDKNIKVYKEEFQKLLNG